MDDKRDKDGRWLERPPGSAPILTSERASELNRRRWAKTRAAGARGMMAAALQVDPDIKTFAQAFALVVQKQVEALLKSNDPKFADVDKLRRLITGLDSGGDSQRANESAVAGPGVVATDAGTLLELVRLLEDELETRKEKAQAIDPE